MELLPALERVINYREKIKGGADTQKSGIQTDYVNLARDISFVLGDCFGRGDVSFLTRYSRYCAQRIKKLSRSRQSEDLLSNLRKYLLTSVAPLPPIPGGLSLQGLPRPVIACSRCRSRKTRCDGKLPTCTVCERAGKADTCSRADEDFAEGMEKGSVAPSTATGTVACWICGSLVSGIYSQTLWR
jgi:Fungal Zn(2)-Cys(6) binuclear cluster domain